MSEHCPQDGGFVGECGCTHPNHRHSDLVRKILDAKTPAFVSEEDGDKALREGFYVATNDADGKTRSVGFGGKILDHWNDKREGHTHDPKDVKARKERLAFAVDAVRSYDRTETNHRDYPGRRIYFKAYDRFGMTVVADPSHGDRVDAFTYIPKRGDRKKGQGGAGRPSKASLQPAGANSRCLSE